MLTNMSLFDRPKSEKNFRNKKNAEIVGSWVKNGRFRHLKRQNSDIFKDIYLIFLHLYTWQGSFTYIPVFWKFRNIPKFCENNIFLCIYNFQKLQNFENAR